jgi:hypothetical protein
MTTLNYMHIPSQYRITMGGRHYSPRMLALKDVAAYAFKLSKVGEKVYIEDNEGNTLAGFTRCD